VELTRRLAKPPRRPAWPAARPTRLAGAAIVTVAGLALCSCGSTRPAAAGQGGSAQRYAEAPAMLVQCGFDRGTVSPGGLQPWYRQGHVLPLAGGNAGQHSAQFMAWWTAHAAETVSGKTLTAWRRWAASRDQLPPAICGSFATAASLHAQIFPGQPNPWKA
jgi:hypothetical protein